MTKLSAASTAAPRTRRWRVVDIVVAALVAVAGGVIFWAWDAGSTGISAVTAAYPPLSGLYGGGWMIPAVLGALIVRKPGAAVFCEAVAACSELVLGSPYGLTVVASGVLQGLGAELIFALFLYRNFRLPASLLAGAGAGLMCAVNDCFLPWGWNIAYAPVDKLVYFLVTTISGVLIAGVLSWLAARGLARTGVLSAFASRRAASEPVL